MKLRLFTLGSAACAFHLCVGCAVHGESVKSLAREGTNKPPQINLTWPRSGSLFGTGTVLWILADATDPDGNIAEVRFFVETNLLAVVTERPFAARWIVEGFSTPSNLKLLSALAIDDKGLAGEASAINVYYSGTRPVVPVVAIISPTNDVFASPATLTFSATALAMETDGPVPIDFHLNDGMLGRATKVATPSDPHSIIVSNLVDGDYLLRTSYGGQNRDLCRCQSYRILVTKLGLRNPIIREDRSLQFEVVTAFTNSPVVIQVSSDLAAWSDISTNLRATGLFTVVEQPRASRSFYRAVSR